MASKWEIVIKTEGLEGATSNSKTTSKKSRSGASGGSIKKTSSIKRQRKLVKAFNSAKSYATHPVSSALGTIAKSVPMVATVVAVGTAAISIVDTTASAIETYTGQTSLSFAWTNAKKAMSAIMNPISFGKNSILTSLTINKENQKQAQARELVGNSVSNLTGKGV